MPRGFRPRRHSRQARGVVWDHGGRGRQVRGEVSVDAARFQTSRRGFKPGRHGPQARGVVSNHEAEVGEDAARFLSTKTRSARMPRGFKTRRRGRLARGDGGMDVLVVGVVDHVDGGAGRVIARLGSRSGPNAEQAQSICP